MKKQNLLIACGNDFTVVVQNNKIIIKGGGVEIHRLPEKLNLKVHKIKMIKAAYNNVLVVTECNKLFVWGDNSYNQCFTDNISINKMKDISIGNGYIGMLKTDGTIVMWGKKIANKKEWQKYKNIKLFRCMAEVAIAVDKNNNIIYISKLITEKTANLLIKKKFSTPIHSLYTLKNSFFVKFKNREIDFGGKIDCFDNSVGLQLIVAMMSNVKTIITGNDYFIIIRDNGKMDAYGNDVPYDFTYNADISRKDTKVKEMVGGANHFVVYYDNGDCIEFYWISSVSHPKQYDLNEYIDSYNYSYNEKANYMI